MTRVEIDEDCNETVAHLGGVRRAVKHAADKGAAIARGVLIAHRHEGDAVINVTRGLKTDYFVNLDDSKGQGAAAAIEFGNKYGGGNVRPLTRAFNLKHGPRRQRNSGRAAGRAT